MQVLKHHHRWSFHSHPDELEVHKTPKIKFLSIVALCLHCQADPPPWHREDLSLGQASLVET
ncbi:hypothetical protein Mapa_017214 [Marchantia paleacea]|nr:hypothetical protein Mapa_017214 [Marchantia paleacea]